ncbi:MAG: thioesterase [Coprobacillus sp.]|nr:thioesterase [Coprobacillus sp.]
MHWEKFKKVYPVTINSVDLYDRLTPTTILDYLQDASVKNVDGTDIDFLSMKSKGLLWIITRTRYDILSFDAKFGDEVIVTTWPNKNDKFSINRNYTVEKTDGTPILIGKFKWAVIDMNTRKLYPLDEVFGEDDTFEEDEIIEGQLMGLQIDESTLNHQYHFKVGYNHIDHNGHMNNTRYLYELMDALDLDSKHVILSCEANYMKELSKDEEITIKYSYTDEKVEAIFYGDDGEKTKIRLKLEVIE